MTDSFVLAQISDLHIGARGKRGRPNAGACLRAALKAVAKRKPDAIVATGDLANDQGAREYAELRRILAKAPAPVFLLPGNHDHRDRLRAAFPAHDYLPRESLLCYAIETFPVRIVAIDQVVHDEVGGTFTEDHARWLDATLRQEPGKPTIVALHHPPFFSHDRLFDTMGLAGDDLMAGVIRRHPQVVRIICGHHHRFIVGALAHVPVVSAPSTAWSYGLALRAEEPVAPITTEPCGFVLHVWRAGGGMASHFCPV